MRKYILFSILAVAFSSTSVFGQLREHLIGIKVAYNLSGVTFNPANNELGITTYKNYSLVYTYYHDLWKTMPYFGFQASFSYQEQGYQLADTITRLTVYEVPLVSQFHIDFWRMRFLINMGGFMGYRAANSQGFEKLDNKIDYGFIGGLGLAFVFKPVELHLEANYQHSFSFLFDPKKYSETNLQFTYPHQLLLSCALYFHL